MAGLRVAGRGFVGGLLIAVFACAATAVAGAGGPSASAGRPLSAADRSFVDGSVRQVMRRARVPGVMISVSGPAGVYRHAYGVADVASRARMRLGLHVRVPGIGETLTAMAILEQVQRRRISLSAKLARWVRGIPYGSRITVGELLGMRSGVYDFRLAGQRRSSSPAAVVSIIRRHKPLFSPGAQTRYDPSNYVLLGIILRGVTHRSPESVITHDVIGVAHLAHTGFPTWAGLPFPYAHGYEPPRTGKGPLRDYTRLSPGLARAVGELPSTLGDLQTWGRTLATGALISPTLRAQQLQFHAVTGATGSQLEFGLGLERFGDWLGQDGSSYGYSAATFYQPATGAQIVVVANLSSGSASPTLPLFATIAQRLYGTTTPPPVTPPSPSPSPSPPPPPAPADHVVVAVGDIACAPGDTSNNCEQALTANLASSQHPDAVLALGDNQYDSGLLSEYRGTGAYGATWGVFDPIVYPVPGNHEYAISSTADGYFSFFGGAAALHGSTASAPYYSFNLGSWHIVALNSNCSDSGCADALGGTTSSAQTSWLQSDLAANRSACVLAFWHHPLISAGDIGNSPNVQPLWTALYNAHADVVLGGHDHLYEQYQQLGPDGKPDSAGVREFVVGTGGENLVGYDPTHVAPTAPTFTASQFGVLVLTLHTNSYDWNFLNINGASLDSGSAVPCHGRGGGSAPLAARDVANGSSSGLFLPALAFDARPNRSSLAAAKRRGLAVDVHCSRGCDVTISASVRRAGRARRIATYYETESQIPKPNSRIVLPLPAGQLKGLRSARLLMRFAAVDAAGHRRVLARTVTLN